MNEIINLAAAISSIILALLSITISIWFFILSKKTEKETSISLSKIETQADSLQKLNSKWMDKLTNYVTTDRPNPVDTHFSKLIEIITTRQITLSNTISNDLPRDYNSLDNDQISNLVSCYIGLLFYSGQTNYWSQGYMPKIEEFIESDPFHNSIKKIIDTSYSDYFFILNILNQIDQSYIDGNALQGLYRESIDTIQPSIKNVADLLLSKQ
ncbi:hypothetical protein JWG40_12265 [Leptospira sp. 201903074]|uniref:hypothetical protein n=1 Tax=Leptospira abararensis TaxID=2810036 RepID=UPI001966B996|nr:hypothetical protein [Leptospira abararensis]MBM9547798.1 hypothetical protein [Leptospira abararensis]